jgi:hypothetical protein
VVERTAALWSLRTSGILAVMGRVDPHYLKQLLIQRGARLEISEPFRVGGSGRYMCLGKVVGAPARIIGLKPADIPPAPELAETTQTLCVVSEQGYTPEAALNCLLERVAKVYRLPTIPPRGRLRRGWLGRLIAAFTSGGA